MNLSKKLISLSLVACLSMQTVSADVLNSALQNYTPPSQTTMKDSSGNTIKSMYYSGGYYFRFNNTGPNQPLWSLTPPSIEAGCNGFNFKVIYARLFFFAVATTKSLVCSAARISAAATFSPAISSAIELILFPLVVEYAH